MAKKKYKVTKTIGYRINEKGKKVQIQKSFFGDTKAEAKRKRGEWLKEQEQGIKSTNEDANILMDMWVYEFYANDSSYAQSTRNLIVGVYELYVKDAPFLLKKINEISALDVQTFINHVDAPFTQKKRIRTLLNKFYQYAEQNNYANNIISAVIVPKNNSADCAEEDDEDGENITIWEKDEQQKILSFRRVDPRFRIRFLIYILFFTGLRISEALGLKYSDFDLEKKTLKVRRQVIRMGKATRKKSTTYLVTGKLKTSTSYRTIPLSDKLVTELKQHIEWQNEDMRKNGYDNGDYVFTTKSGKLYDLGNIRRAFERYYDRVRVPYKRIHTYRHTFATELAKVSKIQDVATVLGHSDITVTAKYYVEVDVEDVRRGIEKLDIAI